MIFAAAGEDLLLLLQTLQTDRENLVRRKIDQLGVGQHLLIFGRA